MPDNNDFGNFGRPVRKRRLKKVISYIAIFILAVFAVPAYFGWNEVYQNFVEKDKPTITINNRPYGLGLEPKTLEIVLNDAGSGLDEVIVRAEQDGETWELFKRQYPTKINDDVVSVALPNKSTGLKEGELKVTVAAFDRTFWANRRHYPMVFPVSFHPPKIEVVTQQHNAVVGGSSLVFFKADGDIALTSVRAGAEFVPGFEARAMDKDFESVPNLYFVLFPVPLGFKRSEQKILLDAVDKVGNHTQVSFPYTVHEEGMKPKAIAISPDYYEQKITPLFEKYVELDAKWRSAPREQFLPATTLDEKIRRFRDVNEKYRELIERSLKPLFAHPKQIRYWNGKFLRLPASSTVGNFGEQRNYVFEGQDAGTSMHTGIDLASTVHAVARAGNDGIVIFADDLGVYGNAVILDHGFGLTSLYGHLSKIGVSEGDRVHKGDEIGITGDTGLAEGDHLHFEIRLQGIPVRPIEWWDDKWISDHIEDQISGTKKDLGLKITKPL